MLYVPPYTWHSVETLSPSVSLSSWSDFGNVRTLMTHLYRAQVCVCVCVCVCVPPSLPPSRPPPPAPSLSHISTMLSLTSSTRSSDVAVDCLRYVRSV